MALLLSNNMNTTITTIYLTGLTCSACQKLTAKRIGKITDVVNVEVALNGEAKITAKRTIAPSEVQEVLKDTHYKVKGIS